MFDISLPTDRPVTAVARRSVGVFVNRLVGMGLKGQKSLPGPPWGGGQRGVRKGRDEGGGGCEGGGTPWVLTLSSGQGKGDMGHA